MVFWELFFSPPNKHRSKLNEQTIKMFAMLHKVFRIKCTQTRTLCFFFHYYSCVVYCMTQHPSTQVRNWNKLPSSYSLKYCWIGGPGHSLICIRFGVLLKSIIRKHDENWKQNNSLTNLFVCRSLHRHMNSSVQNILWISRLEMQNANKKHGS